MVEPDNLKGMEKKLPGNDEMKGLISRLLMLLSPLGRTLVLFRLWSCDPTLTASKYKLIDEVLFSRIHYIHLRARSWNCWTVGLYITFDAREVNA